MTDVLVQTTLWMDSGLPEDYAVNTWHIQTLATDPLAGTTAFFGDLQTFFTTIDAYLSYKLQGTLEVKGYNLDEDEPRVPFFLDGVALTPGTDGMPPEVALCMSFQGARVSGANQARRRGRVYIGPLAFNAMGTDGRPNSTFITALAGAGDQLLQDSDLDNSYVWCVRSVAGGGTMTPVDNGWVDNSFDTQRRRGLSPTSRTTFDG